MAARTGAQADLRTATDIRELINVRVAQENPTVGIYAPSGALKNRGLVCVLDTTGSSALSEVLPPSSVGEMTLRLYGALSYSKNSARHLRCALNGA